LNTTSQWFVVSLKIMESRIGYRRISPSFNFLIKNLETKNV
jgi:hypothetical protein